jgi:hypothetical protein
VKHRAVIIGAGRIGAGYNWHDDAYTHAGAYRALSDRVELVGFVEPDLERRVKANLKWNVPTYESVAVALHTLSPDIVSVCVQPDQQEEVMDQVNGMVKAVWCEKPWVTKLPLLIPVQVNYMRRGDWQHQLIAQERSGGRIIVYGKDDIHTRCHFEDLAKWWDAELDYRHLSGPCSYVYLQYRERYLAYEVEGVTFFDNGGVDGGTCFKEMLENLLDHIDKGTPLCSPAT